MDSGARIDTYNDDEDDYDDEDEYGRRPGFGDLADEDRLSVNMDDLQDEDSDDDAIDLSKKPEPSAGAQGAAANDTEESKDAVNTSGSDEQNKSTGGSSGSGG